STQVTSAVTKGSNRSISNPPCENQTYEPFASLCAVSVSPYEICAAGALMQLGEFRGLLEKHNIKRVKLGAFDIDCTLRGKYISTEKFLSAAQSGMSFCDVIFGWDIGDVLDDNAKFT